MVYKYYTEEVYNISAILEKIFFFCKVKKLNDPFDASLSLVNSETFIEKAQKKFGLSYNAENIMKEYGTCSFSFCKDSKRMWASYANSYKGFVVGYDESTFESLSPQLSARVISDKVQYVDELIDFKNLDESFQIKNSDGELETFTLNKCFSDSKIMDKLFTYLCFVKEKEAWDIEQEYRMFIGRDFLDREIPGVKKIANGYKLPMPQNAMKSIIIGHEMDENNKNIILAIAHQNNTPIYRTRPSKPFKIDIELFTE